MGPRGKNILLLSVTGLLLLASAIILAWRINAWNKTGWVGMEFQPGRNWVNKAEKFYFAFGASLVTKSNPGYISTVFEGGPADRAGIEPRSVVLEIAGISLDSADNINALIASTGIGDTLTYRIRKDTTDPEFALPLETPLRARQIFLSLTSSIIIGLALVAIGFWVYWKKPESRPAFVFYMMSAVAAAGFFQYSVSLPDRTNAIGISSSSLTMYRQVVQIPASVLIFFALLLFLLLHFAYVFPKEQKEIKKFPNLFKWLYGLFAFFMLYLIFRELQRKLPDPLDKAMEVLFLLFLLLVFASALFTVLTLFRSYRTSSVEEKRQMKWPLWGTIIAVSSPFVIATTILILGLDRIFSPTVIEITWKIPYLLIPLSFSFAILKYRLMDIDLIIKKTIIYTILTGIIVALYLSLVSGIGVWLVKFTGVKNELVKIFSTLAIAALFVPVRNRIQNIVDRRLFRKKYDYPTALKTLSREISQAVDQHAMLKLVTEHLQPALQNRSVVIFTKGAYDRAYVATAKVGLPDEILGQLKFEVGSKLFAMMDSPFEVRTKELPETEKLTLRKASSAFIVHVKLKNELVGFISLGTKLSDEDYDAEDKDFLTSVAEQMAVGFDRIRLREQERDFEKAREIQQGLLPKKIPQIPGYEIACAWQPARAVAGDYYDVIRLSESALGICIADVVGKGMPAALLMSNLQAIVRAMASEDMSPKQLCEKANRVISNNITPGKFITFFYCLLDAKNKKLVYTNAGHNRPILFHQDETWLELKEGGLALGMSRERNYEQGEAELKSGDRLLLFTDGVTEVVNAEREEFGEERLIELLMNNRGLGAVELQKRVLEAVTAFCGGDFQDDVTMVVVGVE